MKIIIFLKKAYYRLFFFFFRMYKPSPYGGKNTDSAATFLAVLPLSVILMTNAFTIDDFFMRFISTPIITQIKFPIIIGILSVILNYLLFFNKKRYLRIKIMFEKEEKHVRHRRSFICIVFCILSLFGMVIVDAIFGRPGS